MKKKTIIIITLVLLMSVLTVGISYAVSPKQQAKVFAEQNLSSWLDCIAKDYDHWEFDNPEQVKQCYLGEPLESYTIDQNLDERKSLNEQKKPVSFYDVPVMYNDKIVTDLHIYCGEKGWEVVGIGGSLSKTINSIIKENGLSMADSSVIRSVGQIYVISKKNNVDVGFTPFFSDPEMGLNNKTVLPAETIKKEIAHQQKILTDVKRDTKTLTGGGGKCLGFYQEGLIMRLYRFIDHNVF